MTLTIDLTPNEGIRLTEVARQRGSAPEEFVKRLVREQLTPADRNEAALATLRDVAEITQGMPETDGSMTDAMIRRGRSGAM